MNPCEFPKCQELGYCQGHKQGQPSYEQGLAADRHFAGVQYLSHDSWATAAGQVITEPYRPLVVWRSLNQAEVVTRRAGD